LHFFDTVAAGAPSFVSSAKRREGARRKSRLAAWFAPDLALSVAIVSVVYVVLFFGGATALFRDSDAGWHIRAGEQILSLRALPTADPFSFSKAGEAWVAWEWLSDALVASVHLLAGLSGVAALYTLAIGASVWMWFRLNWAAGGNFLLACLFASPVLSTVNLHWLARPHVFSWLFLAGTVWFCERIPERISNVHLLLAAAVSAVWANMHGSFLLGPVVVLMYGIGSWLKPHLWDSGQSHRLPAFFSIAAAAFVGSLLNPGGWNLHRHVIAYLADSNLLDRIGEFQSFNFHAEGSAQIILMLLIAVAGGFAALSARRPERFLVTMLFTAGALRSARLLPVAALILLPLANGSIASVLTDAHLTPNVRRRLDSILNYGIRLRALDRGLSGLAVVPLVALALFGAMRVSRPGFPANEFPVGAASAISALPENARIFAPDKFGGYLIYRFNGTRKVFFDGRSDFYGAEFLRRYSRIAQVRPGWQAEFSKWQFTHALLPVDYSLVPALEAQGWTELYRDRTAVLLGKS
jgi:hypothetical protein